MREHECTLTTENSVVTVTPDYYMDMDEPDRMKIGHQLTDLITACSFRGKDCTSSE